MAANFHALWKRRKITCFLGFTFTYLTEIGYSNLMKIKTLIKLWFESFYLHLKVQQNKFNHNFSQKTSFFDSLLWTFQFKIFLRIRKKQQAAAVSQFQFFISVSSFKQKEQKEKLKKNSLIISAFSRKIWQPERDFLTNRHRRTQLILI